MTDSTDSNEILIELGEGIALSDEQEALALAEEQRRRKTELGDITKHLVKLDADARKRLISFMLNNCIVPTDEQLTQQMQAMQHEFVRLQTENDSLRQQVRDLNGGHTIAFPDEAERNEAEEILSYCKGGNGKFIDPNRVKNALKPKQSKQQQTGPSGPPTQQQSSNNGSSQDNKGSKPSWTDRLLGKA